MKVKKGRTVDIYRLLNLYSSRSVSNAYSKEFKTSAVITYRQN